MNNVIEAKQVTKWFRHGPESLRVLNAVSLTVAAAEMVAIVGASGSGKSTLLQLLGGLDQPSQGSITVAGQHLATLSPRRAGLWRNEHLGFVYQFHHLLPEFTALENTAMPLLIRGDGTRSAMHTASEMVAQVGLSARAGHRVAELSGGERQRIAIARALVTRPCCVLADEPTGNLDHQSAAHIYDLLRRLNQQLGISVVAVTHNGDMAQQMDRVVTLRDGVLAE